VTKDLSFEGYFKLPEKDPSLAFRMTCILQRAVSYAKIIEGNTAQYACGIFRKI